MVHVPYRGTGPVLNDMVSGTIELTFTSMPAAAGLVASGRLKLLGWTMEAVPQGGPAAPTPRSSGLPEYEAAIWWGMIARRGIPEAARARLNAASIAAVTEGRFAASLAQEGALPGALPPDGADRFVLADLARWRDVAQTANIRVE
jgi:tripartite-type tricarboxylate transporter receptor subunit TctC